MKRLPTLILLFGLLYFKPILAQWVQQNPGTSSTLFSVHFANGQSGWAVGAGGTIIHTADGGQNWQPQTSGVSTALNAVWFADTQQGWAAGDGGVILATTDGGQNWVPQVSNSVSKLRTIWFFNSDTGYVAGQGGLCLRTVNGGLVWTQVGTAVNQDIFSIGFADASNGYLSGRNGNFQKTITGGTSWINGPPPPPLDTLKAVRAPAPTDVYVTTHNGKVLKTDGSGNWISQQPGSTKSLNGAWFTTTTTGWVAGDSGRVFTTSNGGGLWLQQSTGLAERLWAIHFPNDSAGWCVGANGTVIKLTLLTTALPATAAPQTMRIFPNPASAATPRYISLPQNENVVQLELFDAQANRLSVSQFAATAFGNGWKLETGTLPPGVYILRITTTSGVICSRVVVTE
ncbi:MAG: T9SS type A sorting domain-containing protein [Bacteroidetes bacterium]|nr:T9SS type A sorting domain-containing protein [Bacteroidota bacterium]